MLASSGEPQVLEKRGPETRDGAGGGSRGGTSQDTGSLKAVACGWGTLEEHYILAEAKLESLCEV